MTLLVDAQLPPLLAAALRHAGCNAVAVREVGLREAREDEDFAERCLRSQNPPVVVWLRIGNATNPVLLDWFLPHLPAVLARIRSGDRLIEVR